MRANSPIEDRANWPILALAWMLYFGFAVTAASLVPIITPVRDDLGLSYTQIGVVLGTWQLVYIVAAIPAGAFIDRLGTKHSLFVGALLVAASAATRGLAVDAVSLMLAVALFGLGGPIISIGLPKLIAQWFTGRHRSTASGIYITGSLAGNITVLAATNAIVLPVVGGQWRNAMFLYGSLGLASALAWLVFGRDPSSDAPDASETPLGNAAAVRRIVMMPTVWPVFLVGMSGFLASHGFRNWLPQILEDKGASPGVAGALAAFAALGGILGSIVIMRLVGVVDRATIVQGLLIVTALMLSLVPFVDGSILVGVLLVEAFSSAALMPLMLNALMDMPQIGASLMGAAGGLYFSIGEVGGFLGPSIIGVTTDLTGTYTSGLLVLGLVMVAMLLPGRWIPR
ncbi:MFS transporter [Nocardioides endophyticus]|uniref:MFS transporter n=1 Tax=Nocardioides endophyticus TaxID=1353775 RepID=A0ABP8Z9G5_9ACTN